ncbi:MAG: ATP-binding protein [Deltaproteobacteria bacterium]|nr:ATP-binding protein [Deltaproteobacteria bacterium]
MFRTNIPVTAGAFHDRHEEIRRLGAAVDSLERGNPQWYALIGSRKVGKTSLLLELERQKRREGLVFVVLDSYEDRPLSLSVFRRYAMRVVDAFFARKTGLSFESLAGSPADYRATLFESDDFIRLSSPLRVFILNLVDATIDRAFVETALRLPEQLSRRLDVRCVVAWDEFQELSSFASSRVKIDVLALARAIWQKHNRVSYFISGSKRTMLNELVASPASPFFQHFSVLDVGPMPVDEAIALLRDCAPRGRAISQKLATRTVSILGGHPFYLQLFGETLTRGEPPYDDAAFKGALGELLFSQTGRLSLYFQREYDRLVGRASSLAAILRALSDGPLKPSEVAKAIKASSGSTTRYLERLADAVVRTENGLCAIADPVFALWLSWRKPGGTTVPMTVIGDEAELAVARTLAQMGFELVYQSRASRGAFDLLAIRSGIQLGLQVKRSGIPIRFKKTEWNRMSADAKHFGWRYVIASVSSEKEIVQFLDPTKAKVARMVTLDKKAVIENLLRWM